MAFLQASRVGKALLCVALLYLELFVYRWWTADPDAAHASSTYVKPRILAGGKEEFVRQRVIVGSSFGAHDDVYMSVVDTLERLLGPHAVRVYSRGLRFGLGTQVLSQLGIYSSKDSIYWPSEDLVKDVDAGWDGAGADMVILGTCEIDMTFYSHHLYRAWLARPADRKFNLVCIVHNAGDDQWVQKYSADWVRVGALRIMPISSHVSKAFFNRFLQLADSPSHYHLGYAHVPIHAHIPILPIEHLPSFNAHGRHTGRYIFSNEEDGLGELPAKHVVVEQQDTGGGDEYWNVEKGIPGLKGQDSYDDEGQEPDTKIDVHWGRKDGKKFRDAIIQGNFEVGRRDYVNIMADLEAEIAADAEVWGYRQQPPGSKARFVAVNKDAFRLHLAGNAGKPDFIPERLENVVIIHKGLSYLDFFNLMGSMDVVLPSFNEFGNYYDNQASSTVAMAQQCETPLLVTERVLRSYTYLWPTTTIVRPSSLREVHALKYLISGSTKYVPPALGFNHEHEPTYQLPEEFEGAGGGGEENEAHAEVEREVGEMVKRGFVRGEKGWRAFKKGIREGNEDIVRRLLRS